MSVRNIINRSTVAINFKNAEFEVEYLLEYFETSKCWQYWGSVNFAPLVIALPHQSLHCPDSWFEYI
jgi:hypothetical protein